MCSSRVFQWTFLCLNWQCCGAGTSCGRDAPLRVLNSDTKSDSIHRGNVGAVASASF